MSLVCGVAATWDDASTACGYNINTAVPAISLPESVWSARCPSTNPNCLCGSMVTVSAGGSQVAAVVSDKGPALSLGRIADLNRAAVAGLGLSWSQGVYPSICYDDSTLPNLNSSSGNSNNAYNTLNQALGGMLGSSQPVLPQQNKCPAFSLSDPGPALLCWAELILKYLLINLAAAAVFALGLRLAFAPEYDRLKKEVLEIAGKAAEVAEV